MKEEVKKQKGRKPFLGYVRRKGWERFLAIWLSEK